MGIDFLIPTFNERLNVPHAIASASGWANRIFVLDSGSTDGTVEIATEMGATVVHHTWEGYARQKNWAIDSLPWESDWIFILDADESVTPELRDELVRLSNLPVDSVPHAGLYVNRSFLFMGSTIRHCGYFPSWNLRFFKRGQARYEDRAIHEHVITQGSEGYLRGLLRHEDRRGLEFYIAKHNRYSTLEAEQIFHTGKPSGDGKPVVKARLFGNELERRRFLRNRIYPMVPGKWIVRFLYMYVWRAGFMDGLAGLRFSLLIATHEFFIYLKVLELHYREKSSDSPLMPTAAVQSIQRDALMPEFTASEPTQDIPMPTEIPRYGVGDIGASGRQESDWTFSEKAKRIAWMFVQATLFRFSFHNWYGWRASVLRFFGAKIGRDVRVRPTVSIEIPWNIHLADHVAIGDHAILYSLGVIGIERGVVVSQYAHLCAGTHDYKSPSFTLLRLPITIERDAWIAADAFVGPGVTVGRSAVVGARASVFKDVPAGQVVGGSPARVIKRRERHPDSAGL